MFLRKIHAQQNADGSNASEENEQRRVAAAPEVSGAKQYVADRQVEEGPQDVTIGEERPLPWQRPKGETST